MSADLIRWTGGPGSGLSSSRQEANGFSRGSSHAKLPIRALIRNLTE
jgi:hypothetical protein